jgi:hypothetical protein
VQPRRGGLLTHDDAVAQAALAVHGVVADDGVGPRNERLPGGEECLWLSGQQPDAHNNVD